MKSEHGIPIDIALGAMPFEERAASAACSTVLDGRVPVPSTGLVAGACEAFLEEDSHPVTMR